MLRFSAALSTIILLHGCSTISREAGYPGGNVGYVADRYALFAQGQDQQVNRYLISLALLAPLIAETVESQSEAKLSAERIKDLYQNIEKLENASRKCSLAEIPKEDAQTEHIKVDHCDVDDAGNVLGTALSFESISFGVNKSLNDAVKQAFDNLEIRNNVNQVLALSPTELLKTILRARRLIPVFQRYLATYRDISIVFGLSVADSCNNQKTNEAAKKEALDKLCNPVADSFSNLVNRTRNPNDEIASNERPIRDVFDAGEKALNGGLNWQLSKIHRTALLQHVNQACKRIDALASIDTPDYKGCTINLNDEKNAAADTADTTNIDETTQKAVMGIIDNAIN